MQVSIEALAAAFFISIFGAQHSSIAGENVGMREIAVISKERGRDLTATIWYPAKAGGVPSALGESDYFMGTSAMRDAPVSNGRYPLILVSHGAGIAGTAHFLSWMAVPLAQHGYIVVAPTHPGNGGAERSAAEVMKLWLRPRDISITLDAVSKDSFFSSHIAQGMSGVLGLSMGGSTALALAGARFDPNKLAAYCDVETQNASLCEWLRVSGVDLHSMDIAHAARDNRDARIKSVIAIDAAPVDVFMPDSIAGINVPTTIVNLGRVDELPSTVRADKVARAITGAKYRTVDDASHYSMFPQCKLGAAAKAEADKVGDAICSDGGGRSRADIHSQLVELTISTFDSTLK